MGSGQDATVNARRGSLADVARERLIESHLPLVRALARRYAGRGADLDDLVQVGAIGLIKATDRFDPERGVAFATFAAPTIEGEIRHHLRDRTSPLRIPRELQRLGKELRRRQGELSAQLGRAPTVSELAAAVAAEEADVERALAAEQARDSISLPPGADGGETGVEPEPFTGSDDRLLLAARMRALDERERRIVYLRFHVDMTERQIAREVGISQAHVSRLLGGALTKLRDHVASGQEQGAPRDIAVPPVISPSWELPPTRHDSLPVDRSPAKTRVRPSPGNRIQPVTGPRADSTVATYLELPYHVTVRTERDGARSSWSATIEELPGCSAHGSTPDQAVEQLRPAMQAWLTTAIAEDREIPAPSRETAKARATPGHSGRFLVRMPSTLHEQLAQAAERDNVSLNRFVTDVLAESVAAAPARRRTSADGSDLGELGPATGARRPPARTLRVALAANLVVVAVAGLVAIVLLVLALERGI